MRGCFPLAAASRATRRGLPIHSSSRMELEFFFCVSTCMHALLAPWGCRSRYNTNNAYIHPPIHPPMQFSSISTKPKLLMEHILPLASRRRPASISDAIQDPLVRDLLQHYRPALREIFRYDSTLVLDPFCVLRKHAVCRGPRV